MQAIIQNSRSMSKLGHNTLREWQNRKQQRWIKARLNLFQQLKNSYDRPFMSQQKPKQQKIPQINEQEKQQSKQLLLTFQPDFSIKTLKLCQDVAFHMQTFAKNNKHNPRTKVILTKLYGWDQAFLQIFYPSKKDEQLRKILPKAAQIHSKLNLHVKSFKNRNMYNKLKLFFSQLEAHNKKVQQVQGKFMKIRLQKQINLMDNNMRDILIQKRKKNDFMKFTEEMGQTQELMLKSKVRVKNKSDNIRELEENLGGAQINQFFIKEEGSINQIEKYFTNKRMSKFNQ